MTGIIVGAIASAKNDRVYPAILTGAVAAGLPDADSFMKIFSSYEFFNEYHRLFTHNIFAWPLLAALAALPAYLWKKQNFAFYFIISFCVIATHFILDILCIWRILLLYPISKKNFALDLFHGKDTSYAALFISTLGAMLSLYLHDRKLRKLKEISANEAAS